MPFSNKISAFKLESITAELYAIPMRFIVFYRPGVCDFSRKLLDLVLEQPVVVSIYL